MTVDILDRKKINVSRYFQKKTTKESRYYDRKKLKKVDKLSENITKHCRYLTAKEWQSLFDRKIKYKRYYDCKKIIFSENITYIMAEKK